MVELLKNIAQADLYKKSFFQKQKVLEQVSVMEN